ncbi:MAG TPA: hypothetical protein VFS20_12345 [Longimicrobium sp.]|nr:hypothetical protein [Longimicrobium sp.]
MKKLRLELDALEVESFGTHASEGTGTVVGAALAPPGGGTYPNCSEIDACPSALGCSFNGTCYDNTCAQVFTCGKTCRGGAC